MAKLLKKDGWLTVIAVENQDKMNFAMPLRCMEYDVVDYVRQLRRLRRRHREKGDLKPGEEYLSGIKAEDRLVPVFTILFYHGKGRWNVNREFHDMLDFKRMDETQR